MAGSDTTGAWGLGRKQEHTLFRSAATRSRNISFILQAHSYRSLGSQSHGLRRCVLYTRHSGSNKEGNVTEEKWEVRWRETTENN